MPSCPRAEIVRLDEVAVYHCWNRCVRRAYLCGNDSATGIDYEYRRDWICGMQENLAGLFAIEIGFRAELSNHLHLILRTRPDVVETWSDQEVVRRWLVASKLAKSSDGGIREPPPARVAMEMAIPGRIEKLRTRLSDPSWFMATLCEYISRRGNRSEKWTDLVTHFDQLFGRVVGASEKVAHRAAQAGRHWYRGVANCAAAFG